MARVYTRHRTYGHLAALGTWGALGIILTVVIAWLACTPLNISQRTGPGTQETAWPEVVPTDWPPLRMHFSQRAWAWALDYYDCVWVPGPRLEQPAVEFTVPGTFNMGDIGSLSVIHAGWPCHCVRGSYLKSTTGVDEKRTLLAPSLTAIKRVYLPLRPVWPGFALNTLFYAAIAWGLWQLPLALRRRSRANRGACLRCGYDLKGLAAGSACPECGPASGVRG